MSWRNSAGTWDIAGTLGRQLSKVEPMLRRWPRIHWRSPRLFGGEVAPVRLWFVAIN
jgi:hypothetical protein